MRENSMVITFDHVLRGGLSSFFSKTILTFDVDWAAEFVIADTLSLLKKSSLKATFFATHYSPSLQEAEACNDVSIGLHPNFEKLLVGDVSNGKNSAEVLERLIRLYPAARFVRSHCLTSSSRLKQLFFDTGFVVESSTILQDVTTIPLPWKEFCGLTQVPITWEDDVWLSKRKESESGWIGAIRQDALNVINFHPIHIYLNSSNLDLYESTREYHRDSERLISFRSVDFGVRDVFLEVLAELEKGQISVG